MHLRRRWRKRFSAMASPSSAPAIRATRDPRAIYSNGDFGLGLRHAQRYRGDPVHRAGARFHQLGRGSSANPTQANLTASQTTDTSGVNNNALFNAAAGTNTFDAAWLDVDFIPTGNLMTMQFVFSSEEYPEFANWRLSGFRRRLGQWPAGRTGGRRRRRRPQQPERGQQPEPVHLERGQPPTTPRWTASPSP